MTDSAFNNYDDQNNMFNNNEFFPPVFDRSFISDLNEDEIFE